MGCDIHMVVEFTRHAPGTEDGWCYSNKSWVDLDRAYYVFSRLAGVRGDTEPVAKPRGLPDGFKVWGTEFIGDHSFTWLTTDEWSEAVDLAKKDCASDGYGDGTGHSEYDAVTDYCRSLVKAGYAVRVVFGFDS